MAPSEIIEMKAPLSKIGIDWVHGRTTRIPPGGSVHVEIGDIKGEVSCDKDDRYTRVGLEKLVALKVVTVKERESVTRDPQRKKERLRWQLQEKLESGQMIAVPISEEETLVVRHRKNQKKQGL